MPILSNSKWLRAKIKRTKLMNTKRGITSCDKNNLVFRWGSNLRNAKKVTNK